MAPLGATMAVLSVTMDALCHWPHGVFEVLQGAFSTYPYLTHSLHDHDLLYANLLARYMQ